MREGKVLSADRSNPNKKSLFDKCFELPNYGVGELFTRSLWKRPGCFWKLTRLVITRQEPNCRRGKAWGIFSWLGQSEEKERPIRGATKREWHTYNEEFNLKQMKESGMEQYMKSSFRTYVFRNGPWASKWRRPA